MTRTKQEVYDIVKAHLVQQGRRAVRKNEYAESCLYLDVITKRKCAIGALIPDGHDGQGYAGGVGSLLRTYPDLWDAIGLSREGSNINFLFELQGLHDLESNWPDIKGACERFATSHGLNP